MPGPASDLLSGREGVLASCNNLGSFGSRCRLASITAEGVHRLDLVDVIGPIHRRRPVRLVVTERSAIITVRSKRPRLVRLAQGLQASARYAFEQVRDVHSIAERA